MDEFQIKGLELRIIKFLSKGTGAFRNSFSVMHRDLGVKSKDEFDNAIQSLKKIEFVNYQLQDNREVYHLEQNGVNYIKNFDDFELQTIFSGNRDYAILKFLYLFNELVTSDIFPESILSDIPPEGSGMDIDFNLRSYIQFHSSLKKYVNIDTEGKLSLNDMGKKYFERIVASIDERAKKNDLEGKISELQGRINELTIEALEFQKENRGLDIQLKNAQMKEIKTRRKYAMLGAIGGAIITFLITYAKEIYRLLKTLFH